jgi:hypothetical protein
MALFILNWMAFYLLRVRISQWINMEDSSIEVAEYVPKYPCKHCGEEVSYMHSPSGWYWRHCGVFFTFCMNSSVNQAEPVYDGVLRIRDVYEQYM